MLPSDTLASTNRRRRLLWTSVLLAAGFAVCQLFAASASAQLAANDTAVEAERPTPVCTDPAECVDDLKEPASELMVRDRYRPRRDGQPAPKPSKRRSGCTSKDACSSAYEKVHALYLRWKELCQQPSHAQTDACQGDDVERLAVRSGAAYLTWLMRHDPQLRRYYDDAKAVLAGTLVDVPPEALATLTKDILAKRGIGVVLLEAMEQTNDDPEQAKLILETFTALRDPKILEQVKSAAARLAEVGDLAPKTKEIIESTAANPKELFQGLQSLNHQQIAALQSYVDSVARAGERKSVGAPPRVQVVVTWPKQLPAKGEAVEEAATEFINGFLALQTGGNREIPEPKSILSENASATVSEQLTACEKRQEAKLGCDLVVRLDMAPSSEQLKVTGSLVFSRRGARQPPTTPIGPFTMALGCSVGQRCDATTQRMATLEQVSAAQQLNAEVSVGYIKNGSREGFPTVGRIDTAAPPFHQGVGLEVRQELPSAQAPAILSQQRGIEIQGSCGASFDAALKNRLKLSYGAVVGPLKGTGSPVLKLSQGPTTTVAHECGVELSLPKGEHPIALSLVTKTQQDALTGPAGEDAARTVGQFYLDVAAVSHPVHRPSPAWAFLTSGMPLLLDEDENNDGWGTALATADTLALVAGGVLVGAASHYRNEYSKTGRNRGVADTLLTLGVIGLSVGGGARIIAPGVYWAIGTDDEAN